MGFKPNRRTAKWAALCAFAVLLVWRMVASDTWGAIAQWEMLRASARDDCGPAAHSTSTVSKLGAACDWLSLLTEALLGSVVGL